MQTRLAQQRRRLEQGQAHDTRIASVDPRHELGRTARARAEDFTWGHYGERICAMMDDLLIKAPPAGEDAFLMDLLTHRVPPGVDDPAMYQRVRSGERVSATTDWQGAYAEGMREAVRPVAFPTAAE